jgi:metallo-beta-lactamase class B
VEGVDVIEDGWQLELGVVTFTAISTPGHTPGGTSWYWDVEENGERTSVAYADSLGAISSQGFLFSEGTDQVLRQSIERVAAMPCDVFLAPHPFFFGLSEWSSNDQRQTCKGYAETALKQLQRRLESERVDAAERR